MNGRKFRIPPQKPPLMWMNDRTSKVPPQKRPLTWRDCISWWYWYWYWYWYVLVVVLVAVAVTHTEKNCDLRHTKSPGLLIVLPPHNIQKQALCSVICSKAGLALIFDRNKLSAAVSASAPGIVPVIASGETAVVAVSA
mgnify:CR=1 FL=1